MSQTNGERAALAAFVAHYPMGINPSLDDAYRAAIDAIARSQSAPAAQGDAVYFWAPSQWRGDDKPWHEVSAAQFAELKSSSAAPVFEFRTLYTTPQQSAQGGVSDETVSRFLSWRVPSDFHPGSGVSFTPLENPLLWPTGTDLLHAGQARAMLEHVLSVRTAEEQATAQPSADDAPRAVAESNFPETNGWARRQFLADGARFKLRSSRSGSAFDGFPASLSGRWVALVAAENDQHLRVAPPADARDAEDARRYRWLRDNAAVAESVMAHNKGHRRAILEFEAPDLDLDAAIDRAMEGE